MTIKGLKQFLNKKYPSLFRTTSIYTFHKTKIAIDSSAIAHSYWYPVKNMIVKQLKNPLDEPNLDDIASKWLDNIWSLISKFLRLGITPVMVFDGEPPSEKSAVIAERVEKKESAKVAIERLRADIKNLDKFSQSQYLSKMKALYNDWSGLNKDHFDMLKIFFNGLGIPVLQAKSEAEELCAALCREGHVSAVYCEDSDSLAHLAPCWIYGKTDKKDFVEERKEYIESFTFTVLDEVLNKLQMTKETFVDFCIMCGCDYNSNIPNVGPANSYKELLKCLTIDKLPAKFDKTILNHERCRELFKNRECSEICLSKIDWMNPDKELSVDRTCITGYSKEYLSKCFKESLVYELDFIYAAFPEEIIKIGYTQLCGDLKGNPVTQVNVVQQVSQVPQEIPDIAKITFDLSKLDLSKIDFSKIKINI